jgi:outer membrane protein TolC
MKTIRRSIFLGLMLLTGLSDLFAEEKALVAEDSLIDAWVGEALKKHPSIEAMRFHVKAAEFSIRALRLWEDPEFSLGLKTAEERRLHEEGDILLEIDQTLPRWKLARAKKSSKEAELKKQKALQSVLENEIGLAVAKSVLELALVDDLLSLQKEEVLWVETLVRIAREKAKNPNASIVESLRLESELALRLQNLESTRRGRTQVALTLNLLLGRDAQASWPLLTLSASEKLLDREALLDPLDKKNSKLLSLHHHIEIAGAHVEISRAMRQPIFKTGIKSQIYSGGDFREAEFMLTMSVPWIHRAIYEADLEQASAEFQAEQETLLAQTRTLVTEFSSLWVEVENQRLLRKSYSEAVLPKAEKTAETIQNAWVSNQASLLEVLEARKALLEIRKQQKRAVAVEQSALQSIAALLGEFTQGDLK